MDQEAKNVAIGGCKFRASPGVGLFLFSSLGIAMLYPYNAIVAATAWFEYAIPNNNNIAGVLANSYFIATAVRVFSSTSL